MSSSLTVKLFGTRSCTVKFGQSEGNICLEERNFGQQEGNCVSAEQHPTTHIESDWSEAPKHWLWVLMPLTHSLDLASSDYCLLLGV